MARQKKAIDTPVFINTTIEPMEMDRAPDIPRVMSSAGPAESAMTPVSNVGAEAFQVQPATCMPDPEKAAMLKFMAEPITIYIQPTTNRNDEQVFEFIINSRSYFFRRGQEKTVPRFVVDRLARCRPTTYTDREIINDEGVKDIVYNPHTGLRYPFSVVNDPHPRGREWLAHTMREPG